MSHTGLEPVAGYGYKQQTLSTHYTSTADKYRKTNEMI